MSNGDIELTPYAVPLYGHTSTDPHIGGTVRFRDPDGNMRRGTVQHKVDVLHEKHHLSGGAIAGIVIMALIIAALVSYFTYTFFVPCTTAQTTAARADLETKVAADPSLDTATAERNERQILYNLANRKSTGGCPNIVNGVDTLTTLCSDQGIINACTNRDTTPALHALAVSQRLCTPTFAPPVNVNGIPCRWLRRTDTNAVAAKAFKDKTFPYASAANQQ